jgi:L-aspartate oxidase
MRQFDFLIAGSGLAGLYSAWKASAYGTVAIITKGAIRMSSSYYAQGGIAAVTHEDDSPMFHFEDTVVAGRGLCDSSAVNILVTEGPQRISELVHAGMQFDSDREGFMLGLEGGHHKRRILHSGGDATGMRITEFMIRKVLSEERITIFEDCIVTEILTDGKRCNGLKVWNLENGTEDIFSGRSTILALGGASAIYDRTSNPQSSLGDGVALAYNAGCLIADMEFIQFHPTTLYTGTGETFLISEAVRGEGAHLLNLAGERFMTSIHENAELAPRDIVARSIFREMQKQGVPYVYLSLEHLDRELIKARFPNIFKKCEERGIDFTKKIPVAPAAHYMVGGIRTDEFGATNIPGLYAAGEVASNGLMGANRLASNSLMECLVFGHRAVESAKRAPEVNLPVLVRGKMFIDETQAGLFLHVKKEIESIMSEYAGIIRDENGLETGLRKIGGLRDSLTPGRREYYSAAAENLLTVAGLILRSALYRRESRGGHYRSDFPVENEEYLFHILQQKKREITTIPIDNKIFNND